MDTYGHLFPSGNRGWADTLDDPFAPALHPKSQSCRESGEELNDKPLESEEDLLVAVPRIERGTRGL